MAKQQYHFILNITYQTAQTGAHNKLVQPSRTLKT